MQLGALPHLAWMLGFLVLLSPRQCSGSRRSKVFFSLNHVQQLKLENQVDVEKSIDMAVLKKKGWTMLVGDSVLQQEFFSIVRSLQPSCSPMALDLAKERRDPLGFFQAGGAPEYSLICRMNQNGVRRCDLHHHDCLHLTVPEPCPSYLTNPFCAHNTHPLCDDAAWKTLADEATASDVEFALTFHWAPGPGLARRDPDIGELHGDPVWEASSAALRHAGQSIIKKRFEYRRPGAIMMNNCLHSWPYSWKLPKVAWDERLEMFLRALQLNIEEVATSGFKGAFALQTCMPLACTERFAWRTIDPTFHTCQLQNAELMAVNAGTKRLLAAMHLQASVYDPWALGAARPELYIDGIHPCWTRPCSWTNSEGVPQTSQAPKNLDAKLQWTGFVDTDPSLCFDIVSSGFVALDQPGAHLASWSALGVKLPSLTDLSASSFLPYVPRLPVPPPKAAAVMPHAIPRTAAVPTGMPSSGTGMPSSGTGMPLSGSGASPTGMPVMATGTTMSSGTGMPAMATGTTMSSGTGLPVSAAGASSGTPVTSSGTVMPSNAGTASAIAGAATAGAASSEQAEESGGQTAGLPLWTLLFFSLLGFMCLSQYIPKHGEYQVGMKNVKTSGPMFTLFSIVESDPEIQPSSSS